VCPILTLFTAFKVHVSMGLTYFHLVAGSKFIDFLGVIDIEERGR
jgi:hypothetical protein